MAERVVVNRKPEELQELYVGQSHDLAWTRNLSCPTEEEYLAMVDGSESNSPVLIVQGLAVNLQGRNSRAVSDAREAVGCTVGFTHQAGGDRPDTVHDLVGPFVPDPGRLHELDVARCEFLFGFTQQVRWFRS